MRTIARYSGASIVGLNISPYQLERLAIHNKRNGLDHLCSGVEVDSLSYVVIRSLYRYLL